MKINVELDDIFKKGKNFEFKKIDYSDQKVSSQIDKVRVQQDDIQKMADADISSINDIIFDI
ncbi:MAG: hypothetical protein ACXVJD_03135 [Mucilaginibacter sp.]